MVNKTDKKQNEALILLQKQLADLKLTVRDIKNNSPEERNARTNGLYEKWKKANQWQPDDPDTDPLPEPCRPGFHFENGVCIPDDHEETPPPSTEKVIFDSRRDSRLHDGKKRTIKVLEDNIDPRASGNPRTQVNDDKTFSLLCDEGHGRLYPYFKNYNSALEIECAFWNEVEGQDLSLKLRSEHNEGPDNRPDAQSWDDVHGDAFGGYGASIDRAGWGMKREPEHNFHDQSTGGKYKGKIETQKYFKVYFTVQDDVRDNGEVRVKQVLKLDVGDGNGYQTLAEKFDSQPKGFMIDKARYLRKSYFWLRQNIEEKKTGEIRFKSVVLTEI